MKATPRIRQDFEWPSCIESWGWKHHHIGIPTDKEMPEEKYLPNSNFTSPDLVPALLELNG